MEIYRKCKSLLAKAKEIFGDIVVSAYIGEFVLDGEKEQISTFVNKAQKYRHPDKPYLNLDDFSCIVLKFKNGNLVSLKVSEWGSAESIKEQDLNIV